MDVTNLSIGWMNMYTLPPVHEITVEEFEEVAIRRLKSMFSILFFELNWIVNAFGKCCGRWKR